MIPQYALTLVTMDSIGYFDQDIFGDNRNPRIPTYIQRNNHKGKGVIL